MQKFVLVLTIWVLVSEVRQGTEARNPTYGVKLCGREFIRAVIFTCGGSRWKRTGNAQIGDLPESLSNLDWAEEGEASEGWNTEQVPRLSYKEYPDYENQSWKDHLMGLGGVIQQSRSSTTITEELLEALRASDRKGRDVVIGLSNACCKLGCSKSEISSLC
nr:PREDICTED: relaxin-3 [Latimeria chalumnae]|eukprot:XP_005994193.1 PREDICTED: relaxin-3 [Latimeria chalumnae]